MLDEHGTMPALRALADVALKIGQDPPSAYQLPHGIKVITLGAWEETLYRCNVLDRADSYAKTHFMELCERLIARRLIGTQDKWVWVVPSVIDENTIASREKTDA